MGCLVFCPCFALLLEANTGFALHGRELELPAAADAEGGVCVCAAPAEAASANTKAAKKIRDLLIPGSLRRSVVMKLLNSASFARNAQSAVLNPPTHSSNPVGRSKRLCKQQG